MPRSASNKALFTQLTFLLNGGQAHATFEDAVKGLPAKLRGKVPAGLPYSAWQIVEHIRIAQRDILDFSRNRSYGTAAHPNPKARPRPYHHLNWPDDYWPKSPTPPTSRAWAESLRQIHVDRITFIKLLRAASNSGTLHTPFPWAEKSAAGHRDTAKTLLRSALLIADHTAYHTGELILLRRLLHCWK